MNNATEMEQDVPVKPVNRYWCKHPKCQLYHEGARPPEGWKKMLDHYFCPKHVNATWTTSFLDNVKRLRELLPPGSTAYTVLRHVSSSGMMRHISVFVMIDSTRWDSTKEKHVRTGKQEPYDITYLVARVLDYKVADRGGLKVSGAGMDMGFHVVYTTAYMIYPRGHRCLGKGKCPSNDHANGLREYGRGVWHRDGGYVIKHRWM